MTQAKQLKKTRIVKKTKKTEGLEVAAYDISGRESGKLSLPKEMFDVKPNTGLIAQYVRVYRANQRQGTASTKTRSEVVGSTRKIYRQKGTGKARHGDIKAPIFVGGGIVGGPKPRDFSLKMNKKQKKIALFSALTIKRKDDSILGLIDSVLKIEPKTKNVFGLVRALGLVGKKVVFMIPGNNRNFTLAARNIEKISLINAESVNAYKVLAADKILITEGALEQIKKVFI